MENGDGKETSSQTFVKISLRKCFHREDGDESYCPTENFPLPYLLVPSTDHVDRCNLNYHQHAPFCPLLENNRTKAGAASLVSIKSPSVSSTAPLSSFLAPSRHFGAPPSHGNVNNPTKAVNRT